MHDHDASQDAADEPGYPLAPLPVHERAWRHPSEMGRESWEATEPPVAIGRGLFLATTAIGFVLGMAVLVLLMPGDDGRLIATRSVQPVIGTEAVANTVLLRHRSDDELPSDAMAVAVAVSGHGMMITTANAVMNAADGTIDGLDPVSILGTHGDGEGTVVSVVGSLAFILPAAAVDVAEFDDIGAAQPGDSVTVLAESPIDVTYGTEFGDDLAQTGVREGTPVVDGRGALVALCTLVRRGGTLVIDLVPVPQVPPPAGQQATAASPPTSD